jgi:hypothetical protein
VSDPYVICAICDQSRLCRLHGFEVSPITSATAWLGDHCSEPGKACRFRYHLGPIFTLIEPATSDQS